MEIGKVEIREFELKEARTPLQGEEGFQYYHSIVVLREDQLDLIAERVVQKLTETAPVLKLNAELILRK